VGSSLGGRRIIKKPLDPRILLQDLKRFLQLVHVHRGLRGAPQARPDVALAKAAVGLDRHPRELALHGPDLDHTVAQGLLGEDGAGAHVASARVGEGQRVGEADEIGVAQLALQVGLGDLGDLGVGEHRVPGDAHLADEDAQPSRDARGVGAAWNRHRRQDVAGLLLGRLEAGQGWPLVSGAVQGQRALGRRLARRERGREREQGERGNPPRFAAANGSLGSVRRRCDRNRVRHLHHSPCERCV
jgi:hypothetical protein